MSRTKPRGKISEGSAKIVNSKTTISFSQICNENYIIFVAFTLSHKEWLHQNLSKQKWLFGLDEFIVDNLAKSGYNKIAIRFRRIFWLKLAIL